MSGISVGDPTGDGCSAWFWLGAEPPAVEGCFFGENANNSGEMEVHLFKGIRSMNLRAPFSKVACHSAW